MTRYGPSIRVAHEFGLSWTRDVMGWSGPPTELHLRVLCRWLDDRERGREKWEWYAARFVQAVEFGPLKNPSKNLRDRLLKFSDGSEGREERLPPGIKRLTKADIAEIQTQAAKTRAGVGLQNPLDGGRTIQPTVVKADGTVVGPNYADRPISTRRDVTYKVGKEEG